MSVNDEIEEKKKELAALEAKISKKKKSTPPKKKWTLEYIEERFGVKIDKIKSKASRTDEQIIAYYKDKAKHAGRYKTTRKELGKFGKNMRYIKKKQ